MKQKSLTVGERGFTLMELIIVVAVLSLLFLLVLFAIDPQTSIHKAYDSQRKKDLEIIKVAFEDYYSDHSCYPDQETLNNCDSNELRPYLQKIPCDPTSSLPYEIIAEPVICPQNFVAYAKLKYDKDKNADDFGCFSVASANAVKNPDHDCTDHFNP